MIPFLSADQMLKSLYFWDSTPWFTAKKSPDTAQYSRCSQPLSSLSCFYPHRVHTERQLPISGVHSIMMEKSAPASEGGKCTARPPPFTLLPSRTKLQCTLQLSGQRYTPTISSLPYMNSVVILTSLHVLHYLKGGIINNSSLHEAKTMQLPNGHALNLLYCAQIGYFQNGIVSHTLQVPQCIMHSHLAQCRKSCFVYFEACSRPKHSGQIIKYNGQDRIKTYNFDKMCHGLA